MTVAFACRLGRLLAGRLRRGLPLTLPSRSAVRPCFVTILSSGQLISLPVWLRFSLPAPSSPRLP